MLKIISGGQTGVDRAALDAALELNAPCGGWCPENREAEDGTIPSHYPVQELAGSRYSKRTKQNIIDSDATLIICKGEPTGGTALTLKFCNKLKKPYLLINTSLIPIADALRQLKQFIHSHDVKVLNVAGPRLSTEPLSYDYTRQLLLALLTA